MRRKVCVLLLTFFIFTLFVSTFSAAAVAASDPFVNFGDKKLETAVIKALKAQKVAVGGRVARSVAKKLKSLKIYDTDLKSLEGLQYLTGLETMNIKRCKLSDIRWLSALKKLIGLELSENNISDIKPIAGMTNLQTLLISSNKITDITPIGTLKKLGMLNINGNKVLDASRMFKLLPRLNYLYQYGLQWERKDAGRLKSMEESIQKVMKMIKPGMSETRKELIIYNYLVENSKYDYSHGIPADSFTAYGILVNGTGVCEGYAEAADLLLKLAGIESAFICGTGKNGDGHAWNVVKVDGAYYHLDVTWQRFNYTDSEISKDHFDWSSSNPCTQECYLREFLKSPSHYYSGDYGYFFGDQAFYRINLNRVSQKEPVREFDFPIYSSEIKQDGDWLYFVEGPNDSLSVCRMKQDGSQFTRIKGLDGRESFNLNTIYVRDGFLYMVFMDWITKMDCEGKTSTDLVFIPQGEYISTTSFNPEKGYVECEVNFLEKGGSKILKVSLSSP